MCIRKGKKKYTFIAGYKITTIVYFLNSNS